MSGPGAAGGSPAGHWQPRLAAALVVSLTLHALAVFGVRAGLGTGAAPAPQGAVLRAQLVPAEGMLVQPDTDSHPDAAPVSAAAASVAATPPATPPQPPRPSGSGTLSLDLLKTRQYYLASRVHKPPMLQKRVDFVYPEQARASEGTVVARVLIGERGNVDGVAIEQSLPAGVYDAASIEALMQWRFSPGLLHGQAVPTQIMIEVRFSASAGAPPALTQFLHVP